MKKVLILILSILTLTCYSQIPILDSYKRVFDFEKDFQNPNQIEQTIFALEKELNVKIVLITNQDFFGKADPVDAIQEIAKVNTIGDNSGFIILFSKNKRKTCLQVSRKAEGYLPDVYCKRITDSGNSYFKKSQYDEGILKILQELKAYLKPPTVQTEIVQNNIEAKQHQEPVDLDWLWNFLSVIFLSVLGFFGWNRKIEKDKEKAYEIERIKAEKIRKEEDEKRIQLAKIREEKLKAEWEFFKFENSLKVIQFEEKIKSLKDYINSKFKITDLYFQELDSQLVNFKFRINNIDSIAYMNLDIVKKSISDFESLDFQVFYKELSDKMSKLKLKLVKLQNLYIIAKSTIEENQSQYSTLESRSFQYKISDLQDSKYQSCFDENIDLLQREKDCSKLISKYDSIIRWKEIKKREELAEYNRQLAIKQEAERKKKAEQEKSDRIARRKRQDEEDERNRSYTNNNDSNNNDSNNNDSNNNDSNNSQSSSFGSFSDFGGGGSTSDW